MKSRSRPSHDAMLHMLASPLGTICHKMRIIILLFIISISPGNINGQDKMVIDEPFNGNTMYGGHSYHLNSISELPSNIQFNANGFLKRILGSMIDSLTFSQGQVVDLGSKFSEDSVTYNYNWIVPKFDLNFILKDESIGIKKYYIQLRLDEYGQILYSNWPKKHFSDKSRLKSRSDIEEFALKQAELRGYNVTEYEVDFKYNEKSEKLCWIFMFPASNDSNRKKINVLEIPWDFIKIIDEYIITRSTVY